MNDTLFNIPKVIYFCNKDIDTITTNHANKWKELNPDYEIKLYSDIDCENFLETEYSAFHKFIFHSIPDGPIKADFWRICILYKYGGVYSDIDNEPLIPLSDYVEDDIDFLTCSSYWEPMKFNFNPNLIISNKNNTILKKCIDWYINKITNKEPYNYLSWSIQQTFTDILYIPNYNKQDGIYYLNNMKIQILKETPGNCGGNYDHYDDHNIYDNKRVFNNRYKNWDYNLHKFT